MPLRAYDLVPKGPAAQCRWRLFVRKRCREDAALRAAVGRACKSDFLFWLNTFVLITNPDAPPEEAKVLPFNTYPVQDRAIGKFRQALGREDCWVPKSRKMGVTWILVGQDVHCFQYLEGVQMRMGSRKEDAVDNGSDPATLMGKAEFILRHLPEWMLPRGFVWGKHRTYLKLVNPERSNYIIGESTNEHFGRSGRDMSELLDEFPAVELQREILRATASTTRNRFFVGTYEGTSDAFYEKTHDPDQNVVKMHWTEHPVYAAGMYTSVRGVLKIIDKRYVFPPDYPYILDGKTRSPWYDYECRRRKNSQEIAREIDMDPEGASNQFFGKELIEYVRPCVTETPRKRVPLDQVFSSPAGSEWLAFWNGCRGAMVDVWTFLDSQGKPPQNRLYKIGVDVATGDGGDMSSNSVIHVGDCMLGEQVAEFAWPKIRPHELAHVCYSLCKWFQGCDESGPEVAWEEKGAGTIFGSTLQILGHRNVYLNTDQFSLSKKRTDRPGFNPSPKNKRFLMEELKKALASEPIAYKPRSETLMVELGKFIYTSGQRVIHADAEGTDDPAGAEGNHGDRVVACALTWLLMMNIARKPKAGVPVKAPVGSLAWRYPELMALATGEAYRPPQRRELGREWDAESAA